MLKAFGINISNNDEILELLYEGDKFWELVKTDDDFVKKHQLHTLRESLTLDYANYILALAMGAGKTILIGSIIATEFAMAIEYPEDRFIQNALVFAPGTTIIESLKEIAELPFHKVVPQRLYNQFMANLKLTYTRSGEKDIAIESGGLFNLVVTNTEKIMLRRMNKSKTMTEFEFMEKKRQEELVANARLQKLASLPNLGIFSDEAHHTYGIKLGEDLKRVRETINYLHRKKDLVCVVNTTGTPYYKKQTLKDVVFWYGLSEGIQDNILKSLENGIQSYEMSEEALLPNVIELILKDFFEKYGDVKTPDGCKSKIAFYFGKEDSLLEAKSLIEKSLIAIGQKPLTLKNTQKSTKEEIDAFNRLNESTSPHRVILLVDKGTEGWNCPSLFATALIRKVKSSNNFVLQASTRCLRQIHGNTKPATIYLDESNYKILDKELQETYNSKLRDLSDTKQETQTERLIILKTKCPKLVIKKKVKKVIAKDTNTQELTLKRPNIEEVNTIQVTTYSPEQTSDGRLLHLGDQPQSQLMATQDIDIYTASLNIAGNYRLNQLKILSLFKSFYPDGDIPLSHYEALIEQVEKQVQNYEIAEEIVEEALAIIKTHSEDGKPVFLEEDGQYYTEIRFKKGNDTNFVFKESKTESNPNNFGFHYTPYNFDSSPEKDFFDQVLVAVNKTPDDVQDIYFTGALTDPNKTDVHFEYKGNDGRYHNYFPDFVIHLKNGKYIIVEIKSESERDDSINGLEGLKAKSILELEGINDEQFKYEILFTSSDHIASNKMSGIKELIKEKCHV
jgi:hypothetical protein